MAQQSIEIINRIKHRIDETRRRAFFRDLLTAFVKTVTVITLIGTLCLLLELLAEFDQQFRRVLLYSFVVFSSVCAAWLISIPLFKYLGILRSYHDKELAGFIGEHFPSVADRLVNMLDLAELLRSKEFTGSAELVEVALEHFSKSTASLHFTNAVSFASVRRLSSVAAASFFSMAMLTLMPGSLFHEAAYRIIHHDQTFTPPAIFSISVRPGTIDIIKGESPTVEAMVVPGAGINTLPEELVLSFAAEDVEISENIILHADSAGTFRYRFPPMKQSTSYYFSAGSISSEKHTISVIDLPFVRSLSVTLDPPQYTALQQEHLEENIGDILALPGTTVNWEISPSKPIASAAIVFRDGSDVPLKKKRETYIADIIVTQPSAYYIELEDDKGNTNENTVVYKIDMLTDEYPAISILSPGKNIDVTEAMVLPMEFSVSDDFGVRKVLLHHRLAHSRYSAGAQSATIVTLFDSLRIKEAVLEYSWDLSTLDLVPEDVMEYFIEVFDNDAVNGPKSSRSQTFLIRLPSLEEVFADADKIHDTVEKNLENSLQEAKELKKDLQELADDMKRNLQMDWQKQKKAEEVLKKYEEIRKNIEEVNQAVEQMTQTLQQNNTLSQETLEKYLELQKTLNELNSPEFQNAMKRMKEAMQNVSPEQMREAMQQAQFNEEQFRQSIERTLSLLKRIQIEQKVDELIKRAEQMKQLQDEILRKTSAMDQRDTKTGADLAQQQEEVDKQLSGLENELQDLKEHMEEFPKEMPLEKLEETQQIAQDPGMHNAIQQSAQQLRSMRTDRAMAAQQQAQNGMEQMQQQLSELQEQLLNNQMQQTMNALRKTMQDLLQISQQQEQLKNQSRSLDPNSQQFRELAREQQNLQSDLNTVANGLAELSQQSFVVTPEMGKQIGRAMGQMQQAMSAMEQRNGSVASSMQNESMASLNKAATQMQGAMQQMQQQGGQGAGSLMQQLRSMAMQQQQINAQTQQFGEQGEPSQQQLQEMGRLARQQDAVRKSLEQLQREAEGTPERKNIMGDLDKIADEMKEVVKQMQSNDVNRNTVQQQERILSRLLQAQRSMRERDYEQKRKGTAASTPVRKSPAELSAETNTSRLQNDLQRAEEAGYSKDYLELIRKYYESLERKE